MLATNQIDKAIIDKAIAIIEENLDNPEFNVNMFAHEMAMSRTNLFTKMMAITGQTPNDFVKTYRLKKAAYMLKNNPELSIAEIADRTGFNSVKYFSKCFNDVYHIRPAAYRDDQEN
jgi:transcriptional regulator GlxA family with amidase domain